MYCNKQATPVELMCTLSFCCFYMYVYSIHNRTMQYTLTPCNMHSILFWYKSILKRTILFRQDNCTLTLHKLKSTVSLSPFCLYMLMGPPGLALVLFIYNTCNDFAECSTVQYSVCAIARPLQMLHRQASYSQ